MTICQSPRVLIARMSAVGDTILTLPVATALRERYPQAYLGWIVEKRAATVVRNHESLDAVMELDRGWFTSPKAIRQAQQMLAEHRFDVTVDCQSITKTALACYLSGAKRRIGCRGKYGCELSPWLNNELVEPQTTHLTDRSLELLQPLEITRPTVSWKYPLTDAARQRASEIVHELGMTGDYLVINPGANWDSRLWEMSRFATVARQWGRTYGMPSLVVWGNDRELGWAREIVATSGGQAHLAPRTTLTELAAVIAKGRLFVSADTGPLHLAVAVGTPSVALHGVTRPEDSGPYGPPHLSIHLEHVELTRRQRKRADNRAMLKITAEHVLETCERLLTQTHSQSREEAA